MPPSSERYIRPPGVVLTLTSFSSLVLSLIAFSDSSLSLTLSLCLSLSLSTLEPLLLVIERYDVEPLGTAARDSRLDQTGPEYSAGASSSGSCRRYARAFTPRLARSSSGVIRASYHRSRGLG